MEPPPKPPNHESSAPPPNYTDSDADVLLGSLPSPPTSCQRLGLPVCLPQTVSGYDAPFARAYNPVLSASGIEQIDWLKFLDGLNIAITASPPLRVVDMAGLVIGFVPYHWAIIAGALIQTASQTAMHIISKTLTDRYLRKANTEYFEPRGLKVRLMKTEAMRKFVHIDADDGKTPGKAKKFAKGAARTVEGVALRLPIPFLGRILSMIPNAAPTIDPNSPQDMTHRRLSALQGYITPVETNVPPPKTPEGLMDQTSALAIKLREWLGRRNETKATRSRRMLAVAEGREPLESISGLTGRRARKTERRARTGRGRRHARRLRGKVAKADRLEYITTDDLVWVVVINADEDLEIEGRDLADSAADVETIDKDQWEEQLEKEDEEDLEDAMEAKGAAGPSSSHNLGTVGEADFKH